MKAFTLPLLLLLTACQSSNPYQADGKPPPPPPPGAASHCNSSTYPTAPRDYGRYRE